MHQVGVGAHFDVVAITRAADESNDNVLKDILMHVGKKIKSSISDKCELIEHLKSHLENKRYVLPIYVD